MRKLRIRKSMNHWIIEIQNEDGLTWSLFVHWLFLDKGMAETFVHCLINKTNQFEL
jgi:hypothetical protein